MSAPAGSFFKGIGYASCWEDPTVLRRALAVGPGDEVLSIASGGCNTLSLLLDDPARVVAIDFNPHQTRLLRLKVAAIRTLDHGELLELVGVRPSTRRGDLYARLRPELEPEDRAWWDAHPALLAEGLYRAGRTDRYLMAFGKLVRALVGAQRVEQLLGFDDLAAQREFSERHWDGPVWRGLFSVFFHRQVITRAKDPSHFRYVSLDHFGRRIHARSAVLFTEQLAKENYFLALILLGRYADEAAVPPYLRPEALPVLRDRLDRLEIRTGTLEEALESAEPGCFSRFNLSNLFDWVDDQHLSAMLERIVGLSREGGRLCYWNTLAPRPLPAVDGLAPERALADMLWRADRFPYAHFEVAAILSSPSTGSACGYS